MTTTVKTMIAVLVLTAGLSAQTKKSDAQSLTGTWNMGLQGGHVIPVALVLEQDGQALTGTISMPTQRIGTTVDVALKGGVSAAGLTLSGTSKARRADDDRDHGHTERGRDSSRAPS